MFTRFWDGQSWPNDWSPPNSGVWRFINAPAVTSRRAELVAGSRQLRSITVYTPTFGGTVLHLAAKDNMIVTLCVGASGFFWIPIMGAVSDRIGRRPLLATVSVLAMLTA